MPLPTHFMDARHMPGNNIPAPAGMTTQEVIL